MQQLVATIFESGSDQAADEDNLLIDQLMYKNPQKGAEQGCRETWLLETDNV